MVQIVPTLLCQTVPALQAGLDRWASMVEMVQIDFADGIFVPNTLPTPQDIAQLSTTLEYECHLMVEQPAEWVDQLLQNDRVVSIVVHVESHVSVAVVQERVKQFGRSFGLAIRPETPVSALDDYLDYIDSVLLLAVDPGFNGSPFLPAVVDKVAELRRQWDGVIEVDGSMNPQTAPLVISAGASRVAVGSFFVTGQPGQKIAEMQRAIGVSR